MKKIWIGMISFLLLCGCSQQADQKEYLISDATLLEKIENKETFVAVINQKNYQTGATFQMMFEPFMKENSGLKIYEVLLDEQGEKKQDAYLALNKIAEKIEEFGGMLPSMLYFKEGKVEKQTSGALSEIEWKNFLKECGILKGEIEKETIDKMAESEKFLTDIEQFLRDYEEGKEFYLLVYENDRYSMRFSETLKKQIEANDISVYLLQMNDVSVYEKEGLQEVLSTMPIHMTPTLLHLKDKEVIKKLEDNASEEELKEWLNET